MIRACCSRPTVSRVSARSSTFPATALTIPAPISTPPGPRARAAGITVNGLPIEAEETALETYYRERVIIGADAFTEPAASFEDFARAISEKLLRELRPPEVVRCAEAPAWPGSSQPAFRARAIR